jgi:hypothetical protein
MRELSMDCGAIGDLVDPSFWIAAQSEIMVDPSFWIAAQSENLLRAPPSIAAQLILAVLHDQKRLRRNPRRPRARENGLPRNPERHSPPLSRLRRNAPRRGLAVPNCAAIRGCGEPRAAAVTLARAVSAARLAIHGGFS